tara:strand:+ start:244 stop:444 length:201 start_codon:yes stop_codon:yes gene_type:complete
MKLVLTTIGQGKVAIVESAEKADERKGERYISEACLKVNLKSKAFTDVTHMGVNPEGRLFVYTEDL